MRASHVHYFSGNMATENRLAAAMSGSLRARLIRSGKFDRLHFLPWREWNRRKSAYRKSLPCNARNLVDELPEVHKVQRNRENRRDQKCRLAKARPECDFR